MEFLFLELFICCSGSDCLTRPIIPLQLTLQNPYLGNKIGLTQKSTSIYMQDRYLMDSIVNDPNDFLSELSNSFVNLLKQHNPKNPYDKIILVFKTCQQAYSFLHWVKLADYQVN